MLGCLRAITARFGLINMLLLCVGTFPRLTASPLSLEDSPQALVVPPRQTYLNGTSGYVGKWPQSTYIALTNGFETESKERMATQSSLLCYHQDL